ncbi:hypothetical protein MH215_17765 [Paenibacillus sp. ACRSA]|uniref:hypothetical protein n=1 Tax=Paenibacillus sp. ACRSA TaxID=2918211 RepID=UPI001EF60E8C|nr:hypothetical protein [Paenibacillus sp. ACRSA]MCG7378861.1 hypothetical protein [Paenibacillus sp. ACRSA]
MTIDSILIQYAFSEQSSAHELIEFTLKSLRDFLPLTGFKIIKSRKALEMKTQGFMISIFLQANRHNLAGTSIEVMVHCKVMHNKRKAHTGLPETYYQHSQLIWNELFGKSIMTMRLSNFKRIETVQSEMEKIRHFDGEQGREP